jgi:hypothetical protein
LASEGGLAGVRPIVLGRDSSEVQEMLTFSAGAAACDD